MRSAERRCAVRTQVTPVVSKERATKSARKRAAGLRVAPNLACGFVARRLRRLNGLVLLWLRLFSGSWLEASGDFGHERRCVGREANRLPTVGDSENPSS